MVTVIYDGECPLCKRARAWLMAHALEGAFEFLPCQSDARKSRYGFMEERACMEAMQVVLPNGEVYAGDKALPHVLKRLKRWHWLAYLFRIPGVTWVSPVVYRCIARNRYALSTLISRKGDESECDSDPTCGP